MTSRISCHHFKLLRTLFLGMIKKHFARTLILLTAISIPVQGCQAYKRTPISLEEAASNGKRAKVIYKNANRARFKQIVKDSTHFYGIRGSEKIPLDDELIDSIRIKDQTGSTVLTVIAVTGAVIFVGAMILAVDIADHYDRQE